MIADPTIDSIYPWGRSFAEYEKMFALTPEDLSGRILDCAAGPASFSAEAAASGHSVVACDPLYNFAAEQIRSRVEATWQVMLQKVQDSHHRFVWDSIGTPEKLGELRLGAMHRFLEDFDAGLKEQRYVPAALPQLPFEHDEFDLALVSHYLFLYSEELSLEGHIQAIEELLRVAREVRVFPLLSMEGETSPHVEPLINLLKSAGRHMEIMKVNYEFQRGGNRMLRVTR